jgi:hypothetical protein
MKKVVLLCLIAVIIGGNVFAQSSTPTTTVRGTLGLSGGRISVVSGNITYYVNGLSRFVGFIDGLKEGAQVSLDGYANAPKIEGQNYRTFYPVTLTLNGKSYEVGSPTAANTALGRNSKGIGLRGRGR